jgi:hypothetical protein
VQSALGVGGCGREIFVLATRRLQFAKFGSATTLPQKEKSNSADVQWGGFICKVASKPSWRCTFDELESLAVAFQRARHH